MRFRGQNGMVVNVLQPLVDRWRAIAAEPVEGGGVLLGYRFDRSPDVEVNDCTMPLAADRRDALRFYRDAAAHQLLVDRAWHESQGRQVYLGEWHTHPSGPPFPSAVDVVTWTRFASEAAVLPLLFVIVAPESVAIYAAEVPRRLVRLKVVQPS